MRPLVRVLAALVAVPAAPFASWLLVFGMPLTAAWTALVTATAAHVAVRGPRRVHAVPLGAAIAAVAVGWWVPVHEGADRLDALASAKEAHGAEAFGLRDRAGVYGLNVVMAAGGFAAGFPEVAWETLALAVPGPAVRVTESDFAMRSPRVRRAVKAMLDDARHGVPEPRTVSWPGYATDEPLGVALALNCPLVLEGTPRHTSEGLVLDLVGRADIAYPRRFRIPLGRFAGRDLALDEGIYWVLQEQGWFHPYEARWTWTVAADDPRLRDLETPDYGWQERLIRGISF